MGVPVLRSLPSGWPSIAFETCPDWGLRHAAGANTGLGPGRSAQFRSWARWPARCPPGREHSLDCFVSSLSLRRRGGPSTRSRWSNSPPREYCPVVEVSCELWYYVDCEMSHLCNICLSLYISELELRAELPEYDYKLLCISKGGIRWQRAPCCACMHIYDKPCICYTNTQCWYQRFISRSLNIR